MDKISKAIINLFENHKRTLSGKVWKKDWSKLKVHREKPTQINNKMDNNRYKRNLGFIAAIVATWLGVIALFAPALSIGIGVCIVVGWTLAGVWPWQK